MHIAHGSKPACQTDTAHWELVSSFSDSSLASSSPLPCRRAWRLCNNEPGNLVAQARDTLWRSHLRSVASVLPNPVPSGLPTACIAYLMLEGDEHNDIQQSPATVLLFVERSLCD